jgi:hypothetical protein
MLMQGWQKALNQSCTKPLDDFDTTWLVVAHGAADAWHTARQVIRNISSWVRRSFTQMAVAFPNEMPALVREEAK